MSQQVVVQNNHTALQASVETASCAICNIEIDFRKPHLIFPRVQFIVHNSAAEYYLYCQ